MRLNPFPRGAVRPEKYIYGRSEQLEAIERLTHGVQNRRSSDVICFLAPAGLGKTCLLKAARRQLQQRGWFCGYSEASSDATTSILDLLSDASDALPPEGIGAKFRARLQEFNISAGPVGMGMKLGDPTSSNITAYTQLSRLLSNLGHLAVQAQVGVALIIDEAQALPPQDLDLLMRVISRLDDLPIAVLIGGLPKVPRALIYGDNRRGTIPEIWYQRLNPLSLEESRRTLEEPVIDFESSFQAGALELLVDFAEGNPLILQMLGSEAWLGADRLGVSSISDDHAKSAIYSVRSQLTISFYEPIWMGCTDAERITLRAVATSARSSEVANSPVATWESISPAVSVAGVEPGELIHILDKFIGNGIIFPDNMFSGRMELVMPGFKDYLRRRPGT